MIENFIDGVMQALQPTHLLAIAGLGLLTGQGGRSRFALVALTLGLLVGAYALTFALRDPPAALVLLGIAAASGLLVAAAWPLPVLTAALFAFAAGTALSLNAPPQAITLHGALASQAGTILAALALFAVVAFIAARAREPWQRIGVRIVGSWIAASAILVLTLRLTR